MPEFPSDPIRPIRIDSLVYRYPLEVPVITSFGTMHDRPMVLVRIADSDGTVGWGEIWCNFPSVGAEHRARLVDDVLRPLVLDRLFEHPADAYRFLSEKLRVLAIQSGEPGPLSQAIAGIDIAMWDLAARRIGKPLWQWLGGRSPVIPVYASGLNPFEPEQLAAQQYENGYRAFKLKVGFGSVRDLANMEALRTLLGQEVALMVDANQAWSLDEALHMARALKPFDPEWLEEPLGSDQPWSIWQSLARSTPIPLAAGENLIGDEAFDRAIDAKALAVVQPDMAKWGGFSGCLPLAKRIIGAGHRYCPHYLGGGIGLLASAHLLAAVGCDGMLEVDSNPNPLRDDLCGPLTTVRDGYCTLGDHPGLGSEPDLNQLDTYRVL